MALTTKERDALPDSSFAVPGKKELPIHDAEHVRLAHDLLERTEGLTGEEKVRARERILQRAKELGIDTKSWKAHADTALDSTVILQAMALNIPDTPGHPNKHPFKGILTRIDEPSDAPPGGSGGKRVILTRAAAKKALPTLLGMPIDVKRNLSDHDVKHKVGTITAATIEGNAIAIEGFLYAADFPDEVRHIQSKRDELGFSWEIKNIFVKDANADPMVITDCTFTGAAILYKDKAAYTSTSLAASAEEITMTKEIMEAIEGLGKKLDDTKTELTGRIDKIEASASKNQEEALKQINAGKEHMAKIEPHAAALESCAAAMEKDGIGGHHRTGHVKALRAMADHLRASAAMGKIADSWPGYEGFHASSETQTAGNNAANGGNAADPAKEKELSELKDKVSALTTQVADLKAKAASNTQDPGRKTVSPQMNALLARAGITLPQDGGKLSQVAVNKALEACNGLDPRTRMEIKGQLRNAGLLEAA